MTTPKATVTATEYSISCLPLDHPGVHHFTVKVVWRGEGQWAVRDTPYCIGRRLQRSYESLPSSRTDRFLKAYRFDLDTALGIAKRYARRMTVNGLTVEQALNGEYR